MLVLLIAAASFDLRLLQISPCLLGNCYYLRTTMATSGDTWTRDTRADENSDLTRKRQRLSEETETSPLSINGSPIIEALPPDDGGTGFHNAIEVHDDTDMASSLTDGFDLSHPHPTTLTPTAQLQDVLQQLFRAHHIHPPHFLNLAEWLHDHLKATEDDSILEWRDKYIDQGEFLNQLAELSHQILRHGGEIVRDILDDRLYAFADTVASFFDDLAILSTRIVKLLPQLTDSAMSRRDSGQIKNRQPVQFLLYATVLAQTLTLHDTRSMSLRDVSGEVVRVKLSETAEQHLRLLRKDRLAILALTHLLQRLGLSFGEVDGAWYAINAILIILGELCLDDGIDDIDELDRAMTTIHEHLLPGICQMSPRDLPYNFHEMVVTIASRILAFIAQDVDPKEHAALYNKYIKSESDALLTTPCGESSSTALDHLSNDDPDTLVGLLRTAWNLQALKIYIFSNIMDVRSSGISELSKLLLQLYNTLKSSDEGYEHPILQYVGRFMRTNELPKYIFGPESHASLISHSKNIIGFLAATFLYTDSETDLIWTACTTSVEAEFVKASFGVLAELCRYLDLDHLLYLIKKYAVTPPDKLGRDAVETLATLLEKVHMKSEDTKDSDHRLITAFISIEILYKIKTAERTSTTTQLHDIARDELIRFAGPLYNSDDRVEIYKRCVPNLLQPDERTTTSVEILLLFLNSSEVRTREPQDLLGMLSVGALVDELKYYVETHRDDGPREVQANRMAIWNRIDAIVRLQALPGVSRSETIWATFSACAIGKLAVNNATRDCAWSHLSVMGSVEDDVGATATELLDHCLDAAVGLPLEFMTPTLLDTWGRQLRKRSEGSDLQSDYSLVLQEPVWEKLVQTAESTSYTKAGVLAREIICNVLFEYPRTYPDKTRVAKCHAEFAKHQIGRIRQDFMELTHAPNATESRRIIHKMDLLAQVLRRSKLSGDAFEAEMESDVYLGEESTSEMITCTLQVYQGGHPHPKLYRLHAARSMKLSQLTSKLPVFTGADTHRVIIGGQELDLETQGDKQLSLLAVEPGPGVLSICPKYTFQSDISNLLTSAGEVERELLAQFDELEKLLDGPEEIAEKVL